MVNISYMDDMGSEYTTSPKSSNLQKKGLHFCTHIPAPSKGMWNWYPVTEPFGTQTGRSRYIMPGVFQSYRTCLDGVWGQEKHQPLLGIQAHTKNPHVRCVAGGFGRLGKLDLLEKMPGKSSKQNSPKWQKCILASSKGCWMDGKGCRKTTSLRVLTTPFGRCWYKCWFFMVMNPMVQSACKKSPETYPSVLLKQKSL